MFTFKRKDKIDIPPFSTTDLPLEDMPKEVHDIMKLVQLTKQDIEYLSLIDDIMEKHALSIAERHYEMVMDIPEIKEFLKNSLHMTGTCRQLRIIISN